MSKPIFSLNGWNVPSQIAPEVSKTKTKPENVKNEALKLDVIEVTNKLFQKASNKSVSDKPVSGLSEKKSVVTPPAKRKIDSTSAKSKSKKKQKKTEQASILNLETPKTESDKTLSESEHKEPSSQAKESEADSETVLPKAKNTSKLSPGLQKMQKTLQGSKFRLINEMLYTMSGDKAFEKFQDEPEMFDIYHTGFRSQVESWPSNPVDGFIKYLEKSEKKDLVVADMGCGEAELALKAPSSMKIHSFDLIKANSRITPCDIAHTPLEDNTCDIVIFSLSLMGTNYADFIAEANRILKAGGELKIAEVVSRFEDLDSFIKYLAAIGFNLIRRDDTNKMFVLLDFVKNITPSKLQKKIKKNKSTPQAPSLKPCIYKRR